MHSQIREVLNGSMGMDEYLQDEKNPKKFSFYEVSDEHENLILPEGTEVVIGLSIKKADAVAVIDCSGVNAIQLLVESVENGLRVKLQKQYENSEDFLNQHPNRIVRKHFDEVVTPASKPSVTIQEALKVLTEAGFTTEEIIEMNEDVLKREFYANR